MRATIAEDVSRPLGGGAQFVLGGIAFGLLTVAVCWYQFHRIHAGDATPRWGDLRWGYLVLILLLLPVETLAAAVRTSVVGRALHQGVRLWTCIKAEWVNVALNMLTPAHLDGGPGHLYIMSRDGVPVGTALTISLMSFVGTIVGLLGMSLYTLLLSEVHEMRSLSGASVGALIAMVTLMGLAARWPQGFRIGLAALSRTLWRARGGRRSLHLLQDWRPGGAQTGPVVDRMGPLTRKLVDLIYSYAAAVGRFMRVGKARFVGVCLLSMVFLLTRVLLAYLCVRFLGLDAPLRRVVEIQMVMIFLVFFAPTPGGAGLAESASLALMGQIVPIGFAPYYTLLWRFSTAYLAAIAGLTCLIRALATDARQVIRARRRSEFGSPSTTPRAERFANSPTIG